MRQAVSRLSVILFAFALITASQAMGETLIEVDDGGSGGDAPANIANALRLPGPGTYQGSLKGVDTDWYVHAPGVSAASCTDMHVGAKSLDRSELRVLTPSGYQSIRVGGNEARYGLAATSIEDIYIGLMATPQNNGNARYEFTSGVSGLTAVTDAGSGGDAPSGFSGAIPITNGCVGGVMRASADDHRDYYSFDGVAGEQSVFSLVKKANTDGLKLQLYRPDRTLAASTTPDVLLGYTLDATGVWYLGIERPSSFGVTQSDTTYSVAVCKPYCVII